VIIPKRVGDVDEHVTRIKGMKTSKSQNFKRKPDGRGHLEKIGINGKVILKWT
jgi:hypothetical protein